jgi:FkbM family methyltransferase
MTRTFTGRLLNALWSIPDVYSAELPYNLNWARPLTGDAERLLAKSPLVVCDVGARGGAPLELEPFFAAIDYIAFDADEGECARLSKLPHPHGTARYFPYFITDRARPVTFHLFKQPGESSEFLPDAAYAESLGGQDFAVERTVTLEGRSLDDVRKLEKLPQPDFLKLDTQGSEASILDGAPETMRELAMVEIEVEFVRGYAGQAMAADVLQRLERLGFEPLYLNRVTERRRQWRGRPGRGQLVFGDLLAGRKLSEVAVWPVERQARYALLLANYGFLGHVRDLLAALPAVHTLLPEFAARVETNRIPGRASRAWHRMLEKVIVLVLFLRGGQRGGYDSDRGWPVN